MIEYFEIKQSAEIFDTGCISLMLCLSPYSDWRNTQDDIPKCLHSYKIKKNIYVYNVKFQG